MDHCPTSGEKGEASDTAVEFCCTVNCTAEEVTTVVNTRVVCASCDKSGPGTHNAYTGPDLVNVDVSVVPSKMYGSYADVEEASMSDGPRKSCCESDV